MKVYIGFFIVALAAASAVAQDTPPTPPQAPTQAAKLNAELAARAGSLAPLQTVKLNAELAALGGWNTTLKNSPFSADEINESVQVLADGNRIVHNSTSKMYRNSEGRIRRESKGGPGGSFGMSYSIAPSISILDPLVRQKYELDSVLKTATVYDMNSGGQSVAIAGANLKSTEEALAKLRAEGKLTGTTDARAREELMAKLKAEGKLDNVNVITGAQGNRVSTTITGAQGGSWVTAPDGGFTVASGGFSGTFPVAVKSKYETKTEDLGTRDFEGVAAEGSRRTTIIPADAIGNERQIEIVYERWYSKELGVVVYSKNIDPRTGEQTYKLTNINRSEPDPSLFAVPTEYRKVGQPLAPVRTTAVKATTAPKAPAAPAKPVTAVGRP